MASRAWLEALAAHPALRSAADAPPPHGVRTARTAVRGTDLIAAIDGELRILSLSEAKRGATAYKTLVSPELTITPECLLVNATGKLLAVVGTHEVIIVVLPRRGYERQVGARLDVMAVRVGSFFHTPQSEAPIAQCIWHPLGANSASLLVLTTDAVVREYDVTHNVDEPQQTLTCAPLPRAHAHARGGGGGGAFSADDDDSCVAVALAVGDCGTSDWLTLTLFVLMQNGDVWALCPFLPRHAVLRTQTVHALAALESREAHSGAPLRFVGALLRQIGGSGAAGGAGELAHVTSPHIAARPPRPQGPLLFQPPPLELDEECAPAASDLLVTALGDGAARIPLLCIANCDGRVDICILAEPLAPAWDEPARPPTLSVYESIDLGVAAHTRVLLTADPLYPDTFVATSRHDVHVVALAWGDAAAAALADGGDVEAVLRERRGAHVTHEAHVDGAAVVGAVMLSDVYLSYALLALTSDAQLLAKELALRVPHDDAAPAEPAPAPAYHSLIKPLRIPDAVRAPPRARAPPPAAAAASAGPVESTPACLRTFGTAAAHVRDELAAVVNAGNAVQAHLDLQLHEHARLLSKLAAVAARAADICDASPLAARIARVADAQAAAVHRLDALLQRLMDKHQPQLSVYEHRWFDELQRMAREFGVADAGARFAALERLRRLEHQFAVLRPSLAAYREQAAPAAHERLGTRQLERVERQLAHEAAVLALARAKAQYLQTALRTH